MDWVGSLALAGLPSLLDVHVYLGGWAQINQKLILARVTA